MLCQVGSAELVEILPSPPPPILTTRYFFQEIKKYCNVIFFTMDYFWQDYSTLLQICEKTLRNFFIQLKVFFYKHLAMCGKRKKFRNQVATEYGERSLRLDGPDFVWCLTQVEADVLFGHRLNDQSVITWHDHVPETTNRISLFCNFKNYAIFETSHIGHFFV